MSAVAIRRIDVHAPLALLCVALVACTAFRLDGPPSGPLLPAILAATGLAAIAGRSDELRLAPVLALAAALPLGLALVTVAHGSHGDLEPRVVYDPEGRALLRGAYPHSPYPAGAVALFALEALAGGSARHANAFLMIPFEVLAVAALWRLRARWIAACVAVWPANAFFWEFRFDLVPAAAIAAGVALAYRRRWHASGWALGVGAAVKWTPALTALALLAWLVTRRRRRDGALHVLGVATPLLLANLPAFALAFRAASAPYRAQSVRGITGESLPYLPLRALGLARPPHRYYGAALVPHWADTAAVAGQLAAVAAIVVLAARADSPCARAALVPAVFLLTNRIFSPQFFVVVAVCCACAAALNGRRPLLPLAVATTANALLFPGLVAASERTWTAVSAVALGSAVVAVWRAA